MRRKALAMVLSAKASGNMLIMMDNFEISQPKTKEVAQILENIKGNNANFGKGTLMIALSGNEKNTVLAARNIPGVETIEASKLNVLDLLNTKYLLMPVQSLENIGKNSQKALNDLVVEAKEEKKPALKAKAKSSRVKNKK